MKSLIDSLLRIFVAALLTGATVAAVAADANDQFTTYGIGNTSCEELMESYKKDTWRYNRAEHWVSGYITAFGTWNNTKSALIDVADLKGMMLVIRQFCQNNPLRNLGVAAGVMAVGVMKKANE